MARIRTIKPEFPQSESIGKLSRDARLLFVQLWTIVDDSGRSRAASRMLASLLYPYDDDARTLIEGWLTELERGEQIYRYEVEGSQYLEIVKWLEHQKIDKPSKSRLPSFVGGSRIVARAREASATDLGPSTLDLVPSTIPEAIASGADAPPDPTIPEREYFMRGREVLGNKSGAILAKLLKAKGGNAALARAAIEQASQKQNPAEYVGACCRDGPIAKPLTEFQRKQQETNDVRAELRNFANGLGGGGTLARLLPDNQRERPEGVRGGSGAPVFAIPGASGRGGN